MNEVESKLFICPSCGGTFERKVRADSNIMKCNRCLPSKVATDCLPCAERRRLNALNRTPPAAP